VVARYTLGFCVWCIVQGLRCRGAPQAIQNSVRRGETLGKATLAKVAGTSLDKGTELDALARLPEAERTALVDRAAAGEGL
jgi:hypothetical protein